MPRAKSRRTDADCWAELDKLVREPQIKTPQGDGWKTRKELAAHWGCSVAVANVRITRFNKRGLLDVFTGGQRTSAGRGCRQVWYRPKSAPLAK